MERHFTIREVAEQLHGNGEGPTLLAIMARIRRAIQDGLIPGAYKDIGKTGAWHIPPEGLRAWLNLTQDQN